MTQSLDESFTPEAFEALLTEVRPALHRYVAHMIGSVVDAEDVVQETFVKAHDSLPMLNSPSSARGWLFRIAHNKAIDLLRQDADQPQELLDEYPTSAEPDQPLEDKELATLALSLFLKLVPRQRSCVILKDVLGYSLAEISELLNATVPEIKAALHRGRTRLRELSQHAEIHAPRLDEHERQLLALYVDRFNARDFDALRTMLAEEAEFDVIGQIRRSSAGEVRNRYFYNYNRLQDWRLAVGRVEGRPAILVYDITQPSPDPVYIMLLTWKESQLQRIRDYRFARYIMQDLEIEEG